MRIDSDKAHAILGRRQEMGSMSARSCSDNDSEDCTRRPRKCGSHKHEKKPRRSKREKQADRYASYKSLLKDASMRRRH